MDIDPTWREWVLRQEFACVFVRAPSPALAIEFAAKRLGNIGGWKVGPDVDQEFFRGRSTGSTRGRVTTRGRSFLPLVRSGWWGLQASLVTEVAIHAKWLRHAVPLPAVVVGAWYVVEHGSRGAWLLAGAGVLAWLAWPEASRFLTWRHGRRAEVANTRLERSLRRAERDVAKAERARQRANRRPSSARCARRAARMEVRAERALATAARARDRASAFGDEPSPP